MRAGRLSSLPRDWLGWAGVVVALTGLAVWISLESFLDAPYQVAGDLIFSGMVALSAGFAAWNTRTKERADRERYLESLEELSQRDELTGMHNYRYLREALRVEMLRAKEQDTPVALIMFDLNEFKEINDRYGHEVGDTLIRAMGRALDDHVRGRGKVFRYGGDEFAALLPETSRAQAREVAAEAVEAMSDASVRVTRENRHLQVTASFGAAVFPYDAGDAETLIAFADRALYEAKAQRSAVQSRSEERHAQDVFFAIGEALGSTMELEKLPQELVRAIAESLDVHHCSLWLVSESGDELKPSGIWIRDAVQFERLTRTQARQPLQVSEAVAAGMLGERTLYVDDASEADQFAGRFRADIRPGTWMISVPLRTPRQGALMLTARHADCVPPSNTLAEAIARLAGSALQNADTYARARHQLEQLRSLAGLNGLLIGDGSYDDRLDAVVRRVAEVVGCDTLTLDTDDPRGRLEFVRKFHGVAPDGGEFDPKQEHLWLKMRPALTEPAVREFLAKAVEPLIMDDPANQVPGMYRDAIVASGTQSVVVMPVQWKRDVYGLFYFASYRKGAFDEHDVALMQTIAAQIAPAIEVATLNEKLERSYDELKEAHREAIERLAFASEARDPYTGRHLQRIGQLSEAIARRMGFDDDGVESIGYAAVVHDLGKLKIPDDILTKPGELTEEDWKVMRMHPEYGAELLGQGLYYDVARTVALHHHERWDGSGYPFALRGEEIPLEARIVAVADVYDALISARPYKHAWPRERALAELLKMRATKLCPQSVDTFLQLWTEGEIARIEEATCDASFEADFRERYAA